MKNKFKVSYTNDTVSNVETEKSPMKILKLTKCNNVYIRKIYHRQEIKQESVIQDATQYSSEGEKLINEGDPTLQDLARSLSKGSEILYQVIYTLLLKQKLNSDSKYFKGNKDES